MAKRFYQAPDKDNPDPALRTDLAWWCEITTDHAEAPTTWVKRIHPDDVESQVPAEILTPPVPTEVLVLPKGGKKVKA